MREEGLDPRIDRMMAALYGELPEAEERAFRRLLEKDDRLRAEFEELKGTREMLAGWEVEERVPSFVLVDGPAEAPARPTVPEGAGWLDRVRAAIASFGARPAWGLATAAAALLVLAIAGFRVERLDGGIAFRFGDRPAAPAPTFDGLGAGQSLDDLAAGGRSSFAEVGDGSIVPVSDGEYLTAREFDARSTELMVSLASILNDYGAKRDEEVANLLRDFYLETRARQNDDYRELNRRIDTLGYQLLRDQSTGFDPERLEELLDDGGSDRSQPLELTPNRDPDPDRDAKE
jgi:hypothetical protein